MSGSGLSKEGDIEDNSVIEPKTVQHLNYNPFKSHIGRYPREIQLFPLELRPVVDDQEKKRSDFYKEMRSRKQEEQRRKEEEMNRRPQPMTERRHKVPRRPRCDDSCQQRSSCAQGTDVYRNILGPTPDESILAGLQTVIEICGLADVSRLDTDSTNDSRVISSTSSRPSSYYSQDIISLRKSSSDTSQDDNSFSSRPRYPSDLQWYPGARRPIRRAIACGSPCGLPRAPREPFRKRSREREPPVNIPRQSPKECSPPCPLNRPPISPVTGRSNPTNKSTNLPPPQQRTIGDSSSSHCALPKCPVPQYQMDHTREPGEYHPSQKGTVPTKPPLTAPLRDQSIFSTEDTEQSSESAPESTDKSIGPCPITDNNQRQDWISRQNSFIPQSCPIAQEAHMASKKGTKSWYDVAKKERVPSCMVMPGYENRSPEQLSVPKATAEKYDTVRKETPPAGLVPQEHQTRQETHDTAQKETAKKFKTAHKEIVPKGSTSNKELQQASRTEHLTLELPVVRYETVRKENIPPTYVVQKLEYLTEMPQYPLVEVTPNKFWRASRESVPALVVGTKLQQPSQAPQSPVTEQTAHKYQTTKKENVPNMQASKYFSENKNVKQSPSALASQPSRTRQSSIEKQQPVETRDADDKDEELKKIKSVQFHSAQSGYIPVMRDTKGSYQIVKRERTTSFTDAMSKNAVPWSAISLDYQAQEAIAPVKKEAIEKYRIAQKMSKSEILLLQNKGDATIPRQDSVIPTQKEVAQKYQLAKNLSRSKIVKSTEGVEMQRDEKPFQQSDKKKHVSSNEDIKKQETTGSTNNIREDPGQGVKKDRNIKPKESPSKDQRNSQRDASKKSDSKSKTRAEEGKPTDRHGRNERGQSRSEPRKSEIDPATDDERIYQGASSIMLVPEEREASEIYVLRQASYVKGLTTTQPYQYVKQSYTSEDGEKSETNLVKQESRPGAIGSPLDTSRGTPKEEKDRYKSKKLHQDEDSKPMQSGYSAPHVVTQPFEITEEKQLPPESIMRHRGCKSSLMAFNEYHIAKPGGVEETRNVGGRYQVLQKGESPLYATQQPYPAPGKRESETEDEIKHSHRMPGRIHTQPLTTHKEYETARERTVQEERRFPRRVSIIRSTVIRRPYETTGERSVTTVPNRGEKKHQVTHRGPASAKERPYHTSDMRQSVRPSSYSEDQKYQVGETKIALQDDGTTYENQMDKVVASDGGIRKVEKGVKCRRLIPRETGELGDVGKDGTKRVVLDYAPKEPYSGILPPPHHITEYTTEGNGAEHVESTSCVAKRVTCKDIHENIQRNPPCADQQISTQGSCSDKCCGTSATDMQCYRVLSNKEVDGGVGGICLKYAPDLTAQCLPPINLPSGHTIAGECYSGECVCPPYECACSVCQCKPEEEPIRKLNHVYHKPCVRCAIKL